LHQLLRRLFVRKAEVPYVADGEESAVSAILCIASGLVITAVV